MRSISLFRYKLIIELFLFIRAGFFTGFKFRCPCCNRRFRNFTKGGGSFFTRPNGYCPRCNSKARHRRIWLYLSARTDLFSKQQKLLHISPKYCLSRQLIKSKNLQYVAADIYDQLNLKMKFDLTAAPVRENSFDSIICIHVLEHIKDDMAAIHEIYRVLKPGGWALISVPMRMDQKTFEDPSINTAEERQKAFGESDHHRLYGYDFSERLSLCGFSVNVDLAEHVDKKSIEGYGLLKGENIFYIEK